MASFSYSEINWLNNIISLVCNFWASNKIYGWEWWTHSWETTQELRAMTILFGTKITNCVAMENKTNTAQVWDSKRGKYWQSALTSSKEQLHGKLGNKYDTLWKHRSYWIRKWNGLLIFGWTMLTQSEL
jgi:hypothetical protein